VENDVDVGFLIKDAFKSIINDSSYIMLFLLPVLIYIIAVVHMWFVSSDLISLAQNFQNIQNPSAFLDTLENRLLIITILIIFYGIIGIILYTASIGGLIKKVDVQANGGRMSFLDAISFGFKEFPRLFAAMIFGVIILAGPFIGLLFLMIIGANYNIVALIFFTIILLIIIIIPWIYIYLRLSLFMQVCAVENVGPIDCFKISWHTTKGNVLLIFVTSLILGIISIIVGIPFTVIDQAGVPFISSIGNIVVFLLIGPVSGITFTLLYLKITRRQKRDNIPPIYGEQISNQ
jgi:hypothetical protein